MVSTDLLKAVRFMDLDKWSPDYAMLMKIESAYPLTPLSNVLKRVRNPVVIQDEMLYKRITVHLYGQGVLKRDELYGKQIGTKKQFVAQEGQVIISRIDARNGAFGIIPSELDGAIVTNDFWLFDVQNTLPQYLTLVLSSERFQQYWRTLSSGTTNRQQVSEEDFLKTKIPVPPSVSEQRNLIEKFYSTNNKATEIRNQAAQIEASIFDYLTESLGIVEIPGRQIQTLSTVKYSMINRWGVDFLTSGSVIHNKKFSTRPIGSICDSGSGGTPSRSVASYYNGSIPWIKTGEVLDGIIYDTEKKITQEALNNSSAKIYPRGSIVIAMYGQGMTRGRTAKLGIDAAASQACLVLHNIDTDKVLPDYLWYYLQGEYHRLRALAYGNNQPNLNAGIINNYPIVIPPITSADAAEVTQTTIVNEVAKRKEQMKELNAKADELKAKAQKLFEEAVFCETYKSIH